MQNILKNNNLNIMENLIITKIFLFLNNEKNGSYYIFEIYHALLEYIKSGKAIDDMGHPDFIFGSCGDLNKSHYSRYYSSSLIIFKIVQAFSEYLNEFEPDLVWYRDLSTWQNFCKYIIEIHQINYFKNNFPRPYLSYNHYLKKIECPACGIRKYIPKSDKEDKISVIDKDGLIHVNCRRCGKYVITHGSFKYLDSFEKKAKLYVFLFTSTPFR